MISVDGLDYSGKSTCARILSDITGFDYTKIKKGSLFDYSRCNTELEVTRTIMDELSEGIANRSSIILDRSYLSALITGKIYDPSLDLDLLLQCIPPNLTNPKLGLIITTPHEVAIARINEGITTQDKVVLSSDYTMHQKLLEDIGRKRGYIIFNNGSNHTGEELRKSLEDLLTKHFY